MWFNRFSKIINPRTLWHYCSKLLLFPSKSLPVEWQTRRWWKDKKKRTKFHSLLVISVDGSSRERSSKINSLTFHCIKCLQNCKPAETAWNVMRLEKIWKIIAKKHESQKGSNKSKRLNSASKMRLHLTSFSISLFFSLFLLLFFSASNFDCQKFNEKKCLFVVKLKIEWKCW